MDQLDSKNELGLKEMAKEKEMTIPSKSINQNNNIQNKQLSSLQTTCNM